MKTIGLILFWLTIFLYGEAQKTTPTKISTKKGDIINDHSTKNVFNKKIVVYKYINEKNKDKVLLFKKYIDTTKPIIVQSGLTNTVTIGQLRKGYYPFGRLVVFEEPDFESVSIKYVNKQLLVSSNIYSFDETIAGIVQDNRLVTPKDWRQQVSENFIQILNEENIPIFQLILDRQNNSIIINGLFFHRHYYDILHGNLMDKLRYPSGKSYRQMTQAERDSTLNEIYESARLYLKRIN